MSDAWLAICTLIFAALLVAGLLWASDIECERKWEGSGMASEWRILGGCRVQLDNGTWIPEERYREVGG